MAPRVAHYSRVYVNGTPLCFLSSSPTAAAAASLQTPPFVLLLFFSVFSSPHQAPGLSWRSWLQPWAAGRVWQGRRTASPPPCRGSWRGSSWRRSWSVRGVETGNGAAGGDFLFCFNNPKMICECLLSSVLHRLGLHSPLVPKERTVIRTVTVSPYRYRLTFTSSSVSIRHRTTSSLALLQSDVKVPLRWFKPPTYKSFTIDRYF